MTVRAAIAVGLVAVFPMIGSANPGSPDPATAGGPDHSSRAGVAPHQDEIPGLIDPTWDDPGAPFEPVWQILLLPERLVEVMFFPVAGLVGAVETYRLDKRVADALTNEAGTIKVTPKVNFGFPDGLGLGAAFTFQEFFGEGGDERWDVSGRYRVNGDYDFKTRYRQSFARLEGRLLEMSALYEVDSNEPFYGIGADTIAADRRVLRTEIVEANGALDLNAMGSLLFTGKLLFGFTQQRLVAGSDLGRTPVGEAGDDVAPPPGFGSTVHYPYLGLEVRFDNRDRKGRPTRGTLARLRSNLTSDVNGEDLSSVYGELTLNQFIQLLPLYRVLVLTGGVGFSAPLEEDGDVPFHELVSLGRDRFLRGYARDRFKGRYGWWGSAQYQFPIGEYMNTNVALNAALFFDFGRVGNEVSELTDGTIKYSYGVGLGIAHTSKSVASVILARSAEGLQFLLAGGLEL